MDTTLPGTRRARSPEPPGRPYLVRIAGAVLLVGLLLPAATLASGGGQVPEYELKAEFLVRFLSFAEWTDGSRDVAGVFTIGVLGDDPFDGSLEARVRDRLVGGRELRVRRIRDDLSAIAYCDLLFVPASERDRARTVLETARAAGTLTVGEHEGFARAGGVIEFYRLDGAIRFEINPEAASAVGIRLSSQLLRIARLTEGRSPDGGRSP